MNREHEANIEVRITLYGWRGELLSRGGSAGSDKMSIPSGCHLQGFLTKLADEKPTVCERFFDPATRVLRDDVVVFMNERYVRRDSDVRLSQGDHISLLPVFDGG